MNYVALAVLLLAPLAAFHAAASPLTPIYLRCQGLVNPQGIDAAHPRLSWISTSADLTVRGQLQTAYQLIVSNSEAALSTHAGNLWDSGKVSSDCSIHVAGRCS